MMLAQCFLLYIVTEGIGVKESQFAFDGFKLVDPSHWPVSFDVTAHGSCAYIEGENLLFLECQSTSTHVGSWNQVAVVLQFVNLSFS